MQTIHLNLQDSQLEQAMLRLAEQQHQNLQELVIAAVSYYIQEKEQSTTIKVQKFDPFQYSKAATEAFQEPLPQQSNLVFTDIKEGVDFAKQLRQQAWQRNG